MEPSFTNLYGGAWTPRPSAPAAPTEPPTWGRSTVGATDMGPRVHSCYSGCTNLMWTARMQERAGYVCGRRYEQCPLSLYHLGGHLGLCRSVAGGSQRTFWGDAYKRELTTALRTNVLSITMLLLALHMAISPPPLICSHATTRACKLPGENPATFAHCSASTPSLSFHSYLMLNAERQHARARANAPCTAVARWRCHSINAAGRHFSGRAMTPHSSCVRFSHQH